MNPTLILEALSLATKAARAIAELSGGTKTAEALGQAGEIVDSLPASVKHLEEVAALIERAIKEGRDLTEGELAPLRKASQDALDGWNKAR